jgi:RHS repeat-associated protein
MKNKIFLIIIFLLISKSYAQWTYDSDGDGYGNSCCNWQNYFIGAVTSNDYNDDLDDNNICIPNASSCGNYHEDYDGDSFGATYTRLMPSTPQNIQRNGLDCYDLDANINPNTKWSLDQDRDGFGSPTNYIVQCLKPTSVGSINYVPNNTDCDDTNPLFTNPNTTWYLDADGDGYGTPTSSILCGAIGYVMNNTDCDDTKYQINPNTKWYIDNDNDGFGENSNNTVTSCIKPLGNFVSNNADNCPTIPGGIFGCIAPSANDFAYDQNYILITKPKIATTNLSTITNIKDINVNITYFDGLGRSMQNISVGQSNSGKDIITPIAYDALGRQEKDYLPYATNTSASTLYKPSALVDIGTFYNTATYDNTLNPFSQKQFEASPLNRVLQQAAPGNDWSLANNHTIKLDYQTNVLGEVKLFTATASGTSYATDGYYAPTLAQTTHYAINQLYKTVTKDENWKILDGNANTTEEFKDKEGRVVLKRTYATVDLGNILETHDTYYVYDQFGNLTYVLPPKVDFNSLPTTTALSDLCYQYRYDYRNRLVEKKLPGKQWEFIVYDKLDRVIATGPALAPFSNLQTVPPAAPNVGWLITKYDVFNRPVLTGWMPSTTVTSAGRKTLQDSRNADTVLSETKTAAATVVTVNNIAFNYTNVAFPTGTTSYHVLSLNYYDNYDTNLVFAPAISFTSSATLPVYYNNTAGTLPKGMPTISWVRVLESTNFYKNEKSYTLYDNKARPIRSFTNNFLGGYTQVDSQMEAITGRVNYTTTTHKRVGSAATILPLTIRDNFTYSDQDRLLTHSQIITKTDGVAMASQLLAENSYDELGQLISKKVGNTSTTPLQKIDYSYNIRGWLTSINKTGGPILTDPNPLQQGTDPKDLFAFKINYNQVESVSTYTGKELYNGNISETFWRSASDNIKRKYGFSYDNLNRLRSAVYYKPDLANVVTDSYNETMRYDKNGNITSLQRNGESDVQSMATPIDNLSYFYQTNNTTNRLMKVTDLQNSPAGFKDDSDGTNDAVDDYVYDDNGNVTADQNKGITSIKYNHLNLPTEINFTNINTKITYLYTANGKKVQKTVKTGTLAAQTQSTDYLDGFQYRKGILLFFPHAEGYVNNTVVSGINKYNYVFNYTDHLGNVRMSYSDADNNRSIAPAEVMEENHYYPFGLKHSNYNTNLYALRQASTTNTTVVMKAVAPGPIDGVLALPYQYKFQGREFQDELGLNVYPFKYRTYDPAIGRFWSVDPVAESYVHNGVYNFAENRVVESIDLEGKESWFAQDGSLATKAGPYTSKARQELNLYSPSEVQQAKAKAANYNGSMLSQDRMSSSDRKAHNIAVKAAIAEKEAISQSLDNHENLGSPYTAKTVMEGAAYGAVDMATGIAIGKVFEGAKLLFTATKAEKTIVVIGEGMGRVQGAKSALLENGAKNVEVFNPSKGALKEWNALISGGQHLTDDVVKETLLYKENVNWIQQATQSGKTILDIGNDGRAIESTFYKMETQTVYGH